MAGKYGHPFPVEGGRPPFSTLSMRRATSWPSTRRAASSGCAPTRASAGLIRPGGTTATPSCATRTRSRLIQRLPQGLPTFTAC